MGQLTPSTPVARISVSPSIIAFTPASENALASLQGLFDRNHITFVNKKGALEIKNTAAGQLATPNEQEQFLTNLCIRLSAIDEQSITYGQLAGFVDDSKIRRSERAHIK